MTRCVFPHFPPSPLHGTEWMGSKHLLNNGERGFQIPSFPSTSGFLDDPTEGAVIIGFWPSSLLFNKIADPCVEKVPWLTAIQGWRFCLDEALAPVHMAERGAG